MGKRTDYYHDPDAPAANSLVPGGSAIVEDDRGRILLQRRADSGNWSLPGGVMEIGESIGDAVVREVREETGLDDLVPWPGPQLIHVAVVPVAPAARDPAHEHADLRFLVATGKPDEARPEKPTAPLRWLTFDAAHAELTRPNLREALTRGISASRLPDG